MQSILLFRHFPGPSRPGRCGGLGGGFVIDGRGAQEESRQASLHLTLDRGLAVLEEGKDHRAFSAGKGRVEAFGHDQARVGRPGHRCPDLVT